LGCAIEQTAFEDVDFEIIIHDFSILFRSEGVAGLQSSYRFKNIMYYSGGPG
jgi:hypothetical protein